MTDEGRERDVRGNVRDDVRRGQVNDEYGGMEG